MDSKEDLKDFLADLIRHRAYLTLQEIKTLRGQALNGDLSGARRGLERILRYRQKVTQNGQSN